MAALCSNRCKDSLKRKKYFEDRGTFIHSFFESKKQTQDTNGCCYAAKCNNRRKM